MFSLIILSILFSLIHVCNSLLVLPYPKVPSSIASGDKISIPISNDKFIISNCAALGNTYLYNEKNERTDFSPVAFFKDGQSLELYIPEVTGEASTKYFVVVELPLAEAIIKTGSFTVTKGSAINLPKTDGCGKTVKFSNKDNNIGTIENGNEKKNNEGSIENNAMQNNGNQNNDTQNNDTQNKQNILSAGNTSTSEQEEKSSNHMAIIALSGTSVVALVVISGFVFLRGKSYMKGDSDVSYDSLNYNKSYSPKPYNPVGGLYDKLTNSNDDMDRDYQLKCLNEVTSQVSYPVSLSDGNVDKNSDIFEHSEEEPAVPGIPITKHIVEETVINPEKVMSETHNTNSVSALVTTASVALALNECGDLTIDNSNMITDNEVSRDVSLSGSCSSCSSSCSCSSCSCDGNGNCSCSCTETSRMTSTNNDSSLKLLSLDFSTGDSTRGYSILVDKPEDSRRLTNYTETNYDDSRRMTTLSDFPEDSRRNTQYTEASSYLTDRDSRRLTNYTMGSSFTNRDSYYSEYTNRDSCYSGCSCNNRDSRYSGYTNRDSRYSEYTESSSFSTCSCSDSQCSRRQSEYSEYSSYTDSRRYSNFTDSRRYSNFTDSRRYSNYSGYTDNSRRQTLNSDYSNYSSDFCEAHDASSELPSMILPNSDNNDSMITDSLIAIQSKQNLMRDSICGMLPSGPSDEKPPKIDLEFIAQKPYQPTKSGELTVNVMDLLLIVENLEGGCYMVSNNTTGMSGKIPAYILSTLL